MDILLAVIIAISFFTIIPMPMIEWTGRRMKFVPIMLPLVGAIVGAAGWGLFLLLDIAPISGIFKAVLMVLFYLVITGGVHADGLMDTADAYFSRRPIERKLEIMKDSNVGAFAVMAFVALIFLKVAVFAEIYATGSQNAIVLLFIPILSRTLQPSMLYFFPYAKGEGLARMYGDHLDRRMSLILLIVFAGASIGLWLTAGAIALVIPGSALLFSAFFYFSSKKQFGGITGDVLGAFLEMSELVMLAVFALTAATMSITV